MDRLLSHALAGPSTAGCNCHVHGSSAPWHRGGWTHRKSQSSSRGLGDSNSLLASHAAAPCQGVRGFTASHNRRCLHVARSTLQQIDYSFYKRLEEEGKEITEDYLWGRLAPLLGYLPPDQRAKVKEALALAYDSHHGQVRKSGEKYITHPVEVSRILAELQMDAESLIAGLLHDTVEDTDCVSFEEIEMWFGAGVRSIVEGETRFSKIGNFADAAGSEAVDLKALDLQQLFLAMTEEVRIIIVKLADRLHNMRTLGSMPPHKQKKIADETLQVFAPLARLLGLYSIKEELEALSFKYSQPEAHQAMLQHLNMLREQQMPAVDAACRSLEVVLNADPYLASRLTSCTVETQNKALYSLHKKLQAKQMALKDLQDISQLRVVLHPRQVEGPQSRWSVADDKQLCYHVMGLVHTVWAPIPGFVKDYIATPKPNGYQSLHTTVLPLGSEPLFPLEVHIRTATMHRLAQYGIACENWVAAFRPQPGEALAAASSVDTSSEQMSALPKSSTESELAPVPGTDEAAGNSAAVDPAAAQRRVARSKAMDADTQQQLMQGPVNGTQPNGAPVNAAMSGVKVNGVSIDAGTANSGRLGFLSSTAASSQQKGSTTGSLDRLDQQVMARRVNWLTSIREWQAEFLNTMPPREFVDCITDDLLGQGVFVFTPSGAPMRLPKGATVVDFAYHVHTELGNHMKGAKVNGKLVSPDYPLKNADVVEILRYNSGGEDDKTVTLQDVLRHQRWKPTTRSARHKLAKFVKDHEHLLHPDPRSPEARMLEHGIIDRVLDFNNPPAKQRAVSWLLVRCADRAGLLAEVAHIISNHGHNIQAYSGNAGSGAAPDDCYMQFTVEGETGQQADMVASIEMTPTVASVTSGFGQPATALDLSSSTESSGTDSDGAGRWGESSGNGAGPAPASSTTIAPSSNGASPAASSNGAAQQPLRFDRTAAAPQQQQQQQQQPDSQYGTFQNGSTTASSIAWGSGGATSNGSNGSGKYAQQSGGASGSGGGAQPAASTGRDSVPGAANASSAAQSPTVPPASQTQRQGSQAESLQPWTRDSSSSKVSGGGSSNGSSSNSGGSSKRPPRIGSMRAGANWWRPPYG